jgi:hypothetical protein
MIDPIPTSTLRLVAYRIPPPKEDEYAWFNNGWFWRVYVDEQLITELAVPFRASDHIITLWNDTRFPTWMPDNFISVRHLGDYVIWVDELEKELGFWTYSSKPLFGKTFILMLRPIFRLLWRLKECFSSILFWIEARPLQNRLYPCCRQEICAKS